MLARNRVFARVMIGLATAGIAAQDSSAGIRRIVKETLYYSNVPHVIVHQWWDFGAEANDFCLRYSTEYTPVLPCGGGSDFPNSSTLASGWYITGEKKHIDYTEITGFIFYKNYYPNDGFSWSPDFMSASSAQEFIRSSVPQSCPFRVGNPIEPLSGRKVERIPLGIQLGGIELAITYDNFRQNLAAASSRQVNQLGSLPGFGGAWSASWAPSLSRVAATLNPGSQTFQVFRSDGTIESAYGAGGLEGGQVFPLISTAGDQLKSPAALVMQLFSRRQNSLTTFGTRNNDKYYPRDIAQPDGRRLNVSVSDEGTGLYFGGRQIIGLPMRLYDDFGRSVDIQYKLVPANGDPYYDAKIAKMILPGAREIDFSYASNGDLIGIKWPDTKSISMLYEASVGDQGYLTGTIGEDEVRLNTFGYDSNGNAISTERAGGVQKYSVTHATPPSLAVKQDYDADRRTFVRSIEAVASAGTQLSTPNGIASNVSGRAVAGYASLVALDQPAGSGCAAATKNQDFDANGNLAWKEEFSGSRTCFANDSTRNVETVRVEGLAKSTACSPLLAQAATLPVGARKITTVWHPDWRYETQVAYPRRMTTKIYNGQPDPFSGGAKASCAPDSATLADGSPIVVLCKLVEQATTDADGSKGLAAPLDSAVSARVQRWTYNQFGQVATYTDANSNTTAYAYYSGTTAEYTKGDLKTVTNPKQHVTTYTKYDPAGQWLEMKDANNVLTVRTFDSRQRLKTVQTGTSLTAYDYWPTGLLQKVTLPDSSSVSYGYDVARRLTSITDSLGNSISYTLDNSGNRTGEAVKDPSGQLARTLSRVPDALNRVQQITGRP